MGTLKFYDSLIACTLEAHGHGQQSQASKRRPAPMLFLNRPKFTDAFTVSTAEGQ